MQPVDHLGLLHYLLHQDRRDAARRDASERTTHSGLRRITARLMITIGAWLDPETTRPGYPPAAQGFNR